MKELRGRVAVVTGAASGIGRALVDRFVAERMKVVLADIEPARLEAAEQELAARGAEVRAVPTDVSKPEQVTALADAAYEAFGDVHVVCNNAGVGGGGLVWEIGLAEWQWVFSVDFWGVLHGVRTFVPRMLARGGEGHIVNTASLAGLTSNPVLGPYQVAKHAVVALSETLQHDLALVGSALRVSVLCPAFVRTHIHESSVRLRPHDESAVAGPLQQAAAAAMERLIENGIPPALVADAVVDGITSERFCILTHPTTAPLVTQRAEALAAGKLPPSSFSVLEG